MSEFQKLWELLEEIYPSQLIPPLPENKKCGKVELLKFALQAAFDHEILSQDEYLKAFLCVKTFSECVPLIKNVEAPVQLKKEYFGGKWSFGTKNMTRDYQYQKILSKVGELLALMDKLKLLTPLFDRLQYECGEVTKAVDVSEKTIKQLLYLNKSNQLHTDESERVGLFLNGISKEMQMNEADLVYYLNFCIRYIESIETLIDRLDKFRSYLAGRREKVSELAVKLDQMQMPLQDKPSFDLIYQTKIRHDKLLEEMAVIEVTYEKYSELVERELNWIFNWIKTNFKSKAKV